jgi:hypothetical protein
MLLQGEFESLVAKAKENVGIERTAQEVRAKYESMFTPEGISILDPERFRAFLTLEENQHWAGINRWSGRLTQDLPLLKKALLVLVDENKPISDRIDEACRMIHGLGRAVRSAILQVRFPTEYGVYNKVSSTGLQKIGMHPEATVPGFDSLSSGNRYELVNRVLKELSTNYGVSLWALDTVWGGLETSDESGSSPSADEVSTRAEESFSGDGPTSSFMLERQLEEFLVENWSQTTLAASLDILTDETDEEGEFKGEQYPTGVGPIDLLCKNKDGSGYTVIELKRRETNRETVGQVTQYMGWVKKNLAKEGESVRGLIVCHDADEKLMTALVVVPNVDVFTYKVSFTLSKKD